MLFEMVGYLWLLIILSHKSANALLWKSKKYIQSTQILFLLLLTELPLPQDAC